MKAKALTKTGKTNKLAEQIGIIFNNTIRNILEFVCICITVCLIKLIITNNITPYTIKEILTEDVLLLAVYSIFRWIITLNNEYSVFTRIITGIIRGGEISIYILKIYDIIFLGNKI